MNTLTTTTRPAMPSHDLDDIDEDDGPQVGLLDLLTWIGERKRAVAAVTVLATVAALLVALLMPPTYTARSTLLPPNSQQQGSSSAAALAAFGSLGGIAGGLGAKTPDELYVALLKSDSIIRALDQRFALQTRYGLQHFETLRKTVPSYVRVSSDKKSGLITVEVDDKEPKFAADLANAHASEVTQLLGRLAVSEAQARRVFFEKQLNETKEHLVAAEDNLRKVQEKSGLIVLDKQAEALIGVAAQLRGQITEREVQLKVLRTGTTGQNPDVQRLESELRALRSELARLENQGGKSGSALDLPVGKLPEAAIDYVRARRELKLQETLLESMVRQFELAKLDEAKEGPLLQQVDMAFAPDYKSKPSRGLITVGGSVAAFLLMCMWAAWRGYAQQQGAAADPAQQALARAWKLRR